MSTDTAAVRPEAIAEQLRADIIGQRETPGSTITESAVALRFGVARPTARLAIEKLVAEGILRREAHRAARVPVLERADILDIFESRAIIESAAVAALTAVPSEAVAAHHAGDSAAHDIAFHRALVAGQPSTRLIRMHELLLGEIELCIGQVHAEHLLTAADLAAQHRGILDAVSAGDSAAAARLAREHIELSRDALLERTPRG
jgi:DNA-binding GntR family transcriptional regulator